MICADCQTRALVRVMGETPPIAKLATHHVWLTGFGHAFQLCEEHAYRRDSFGEVARAVRIAGGAK